MFLTYSQAFYELKNQLQPLYDEREAEALAHEILYFATGLDKTQRLINKNSFFTAMQQQQYQHAVHGLLSGRPLQYVTGSAWFMGREYFVNEHVLIPRPETEELVDWIIKDSSASHALHPALLDIGTGSGCIPISLQLAVPGATVTSCDISDDAIQVAHGNAARLNADITLLQLDFLDAGARQQLGRYDIIVSNPPYIPMADMDGMHTNVKDHEPGIALFVPNDEPLVFYKAIAGFGKTHLNKNGFIYCELDAGHAEQCKDLFQAEGYSEVIIKKDMNNNWRMLKATL